jgi:Secretion system C-terminal sorting domain
MKKIIMGLILCITLSIQYSAKAQIVADTLAIEANDSTTFTEIFDNMYSGIIKNRVPFGVLADRAYPWVNLTAIQNNNIVTDEQLQQIWLQLQTASFNNLEASYDAMHFNTNLAKINRKLSLININYNIAYLDSNAITDGRISKIENKFIDNNKNLPYLTSQINIAGFAETNLLEETPYLISLLNYNNLTNASNTVAKLKLTNLNNNEVINLTNGEEAYITISEKEIAKEVTFLLEIELSNGFTFNAKQKFNVIKKTRAACEIDHHLIQSDIPFKGHLETDATTTNGDYHVYHRFLNGDVTNCATDIVKPIIISDGYDAMDEGENYDKIYRNYLQYTNNSSVQVSIGNQLRMQGYDVIILNYPVLGGIGTSTCPTDVPIPDVVKKESTPGVFTNVSIPGRDGGADYIERNAFLMLKLIQVINKEVSDNAIAAGTTPEPLVIIGPSMGGQITRYALAYMEKQEALGKPNMHHNCRLWISLDSPHEGATIPMGLQNALKWYGYGLGRNTAKVKFDQNMQSGAFSQLIIEQKGMGSSNQLNGSSLIHTNYYNDLNSNGLPGSHGYPQNCRKITVSNGSGAGILNNTAAQEYLSLNAQVYYVVFNTFIWDHQFFMENPSLTNKVYKFKLLGFIFLSPFYIFHNNTITNINSHGAMDVTPGSINKALVDYKIGVAGFVNHFSFPISNVDYTTFIPTVSSLGFKNNVPDWNKRLDNRNLLCGQNGSEIYFDNYFLPSTNEGHVTFTEKSYNWINQELSKGHQGLDCVPELCNVNNILGNIAICKNTTSYFPLNNPLAAVYTFAWSSSSNIQLSNTTNSGTDAKGLSQGNGWIKCTITNPCGEDWVIEKKVGVHDISSALTITENLLNVCNYEFKCNGIAITGLTNQWSEDNFSSILATGITSPAFAKNINQEIWLRNTSAVCGISAVKYKKHIKVINNYCPNKKAPADNELYTNNITSEIYAYPNPSNSDWNIFFSEFFTDKFANLKLYNATGQVLWQGNKSDFTSSNFIVPSANLQKGIYILKVETDKQTAVLKLIKE